MLKSFLNWVADQFTHNLWNILLWSVAIYFLGAFTAPLIPGVNQVVLKIATKSTAGNDNN